MREIGRRKPDLVSLMFMGLLGAAVACGGGGGSSGPTGPTGVDLTKVASVHVAPAGVSLDSMGDTVRLRAVALNSRNDTLSGQSFDWTVGSAYVATVSDDGLVTAKNPGQTIAVATAGGVDGRAVVGVTQPAWVDISAGLQNADVQTVFGSGDDDVWAAGPGGAVAHFDGSTWTVSHPGTAPFRSGWAAGPGDAYLVGDQGLVMHYDGTQWTSEHPPTPYDLADVRGSGAQDVVAVGSGRTILHWDGTSWTARPSGSDEYYVGVWTTGGHMYVIGGQNASGQEGIYDFDGSGWARTFPDATQGGGNLEAIWGNGPDDIYAVGVAQVIHFDGSSWAQQDVAWDPGPANHPLHLFAVQGSGPRDVFAVGGGLEQDATALIVHDDGSGWIQQQVPAGIRNLFDVWVDRPDDVFAVGDSGAILHYDGTAWRSQPSGTGETLHSVWGSGPSDVYAAGYQGTLLHYDGSAWSALPPPPWWLGDLGGSGPGDLYATAWDGAGGHIVHYDGSTWQSLESDSGQVADALWVDSAGSVAAVGGHSLVLRLQGGTWDRIAPPPDHSTWLRGVWIGPSGFGVAVAEGAILERSGGQWRQVTGAEGLEDVWGTDSTHVFAVGSDAVYRSLILRRQGGAWQRTGPELSYRLAAIGGRDAEDVYAVGEGGLVLHFDGTGWTREDAGVSSSLSDVWVSPAGRVYIAGVADGRGFLLEGIR